MYLRRSPAAAVRTDLLFTSKPRLSSRVIHGGTKELDRRYWFCDQILCLSVCSHGHGSKGDYQRLAICQFKLLYRRNYELLVLNDFFSHVVIESQSISIGLSIRRLILYRRTSYRRLLLIRSSCGQSYCRGRRTGASVLVKSEKVNAVRWASEVCPK